MDRIGDRVRDYRNSRGFSQARLGEAIGMSQEGVSSIERGRTQASRDVVRKIADALGIPPSDIEGGTEDVARHARLREVPVISWVSAGQVTEVGDLDAFRSGEKLLLADLPAGDYFATSVRGDSMDRQSPEGSRLLVNAADRTPRPGRSYIFSLRGETTYKRFQSDPVTRFEPYSTNPSNQTIYPRNDNDWMVIGRVVRSWLDLE